MSKNLNLAFDEKYKRILKKLGKNHLIPAFDNLLHRLSQMRYIAFDQYRSAISKYKEMIRINNSLSSRLPEFSYYNFQRPPDITSIIENYHNQIRQVIQLLQKILNSLSDHLEKLEGTNPKPISVDFSKFIQSIVSGAYSDYRSKAQSMVTDEYKFFCQIRWLRNKLTNNPKREFIYRSDQNFLLIVKGSVNDDNEIKLAEIPNLGSDGIFTCTFDLDIIMNDQTTEFIKYCQEFVDQLFKELEVSLEGSNVSL